MGVSPAREFSIYAVATEQMASMLRISMVYESRGANAKQTEQEWEVVKARWAGKLTTHADCVDVVQATSKAGASLRDQCRQGGRYKHEAFAALKEVAIMGTRESREQAEKEGWEAQ